MPNIFFYRDGRGVERGQWPGICRRVTIIKDGVEHSVPRKEGQFQLGLVINKEKLIFYKGGLGFYQFHPEDQSCTDVAPDQIPVIVGNLDARERPQPIIVHFGGSYFLDCLVTGIDYRSVLDSIQYGNPDRLYAMLQYYLLSNDAACRAETWFKHNYTRFLYPKANLASQRISDFYASLGRDEVRRDYLIAHIKYLLKSTDEELCILIDSTGLPNKCSIPYTRVSNHEGDINIEFRVIVVVQKATGLPVYYEMIPGNVVDVSTINNVMLKLKNYGYNVTFALGDAAYSCPSNLERLVLSGIDFLTRLNPAYDLFQSVVKENAEQLNDHNLDVMYNGRLVTIVRTKTVVAYDKDTGKEVEGYVYLCRDLKAYHSRSSSLMSSKALRSMSSGKIMEEMNKYGVFALISTIDIPNEEILKEYYMRQAVEQFFDYAKNYAEFLPVRNHSVETIKGHLLMAFAASFILVLIKNRLNILDTDYVVVPTSLRDEIDDSPCVEVHTQQGIELMVRQEKQMEIFKSSPSAMFNELQFQMAEVFDAEIVPSVQTSGATQFYKSFHIDIPRFVALDKDQVPTPCYKEGEGNRCTRRLAFLKRSMLTQEQLKKREKDGDLKKLKELADKHGIPIPLPNGKTETQGKQSDTAISEKSTQSKGKKGRPKGSKNKKTLEREKASSETMTSTIPQKRGRGRPKGSKNKKTLEREKASAEAVDSTIPQKRGRGRPKGSKNKKTLEREAAQAAEKKEGPSNST